MPSTPIPAADLPLVSPGASDSVVGVDESTGNARRFPAAGLPTSFTQSGGDSVTRTMQDKAREIVTPEDKGAVGDGVTDDEPAITAAADENPGVIELPSEDGYSLGSVPVVGTSTLIGRKLAALVGSGAADLEAINALLIESGYIGGIPIASDVRNKKLEIVAGVIRQDVTTKSEWAFIQDTAHAQTGFNATYASAVALPPFGNLRAAGGSLYINFKKTYKRAITLIVAPDETLSNGYGLTCGVSLGLDYFSIQAKISKQIAGRIYYDGSAWQVQAGTLQGAAPQVSFSSGTLTVTHYDGSSNLEYCPGVDVRLTRFTNNGSVIPYEPALKNVLAGSFTVNFVNAAGSAFVTTADTKMSFYYSKAASMPCNMDGTSGFDAIPFHTGGNLWIIGIMEAN